MARWSGSFICVLFFQSVTQLRFDPSAIRDGSSTDELRCGRSRGLAQSFPCRKSSFIEMQLKRQLYSNQGGNIVTQRPRTRKTMIQPSSSVEFSSISKLLSSLPFPLLSFSRGLQLTSALDRYLRKALFPLHSSLRLAGLLPPLDCPHHLRRDDLSPFREGVVVAKGEGKAAAPVTVDIGQWETIEVEGGENCDLSTRVTVRMPEDGYPIRQSLDHSFNQVKS